MARILLAEDDDSVRAFVSRALCLDRHEVFEATDGAKGLELLSQLDGKIDLLLSDIQMPVMDGLDLAHRAARKYPKVTIVMMTGYAHQRERAAPLDSIVHEVILKPFTLAEIRHHVSAALAAKHQ
jgi:CheY-like chemotaxis protein